MSSEILAHVGFDWLCVDLQHGLIDYKDLVPMLQAIQATSCIPFVRTTWNDTAEVNKALDAGAQGIIVPLVNSAEDARRAVSAMRYPMSGGIRSTGPTRAGVVLGAEYVAHADNEVALLVQIETAEALANVDSIAATPGVDCLYIGPADLAMSMGIVPTGSTAQWQASVFDVPEHRAACATILAAARKHGKAAVAHVPLAGAAGDALAQRLLAEGFHGVMLGMDRAWMQAGAAAALASARKAVPLAAAPRRGALDPVVLGKVASGELSVEEATATLAKL